MVSTWFPPMVGGPRNLFHHLRGLPGDDYAVLTSYLNFAASELDPTSWLPCKYSFFDYVGDADRRSTRLAVDRGKIRFRFIEGLHRLGVLTRLRPLGKVGALLDPLLRGLRVAAVGLCIARGAGFRAVVAVSDPGSSLIGGLLLSLALGRPLVVFFFDLYADNHFSRAYRFWAIITEPLIARRAAAVIVTNEATRDFLCRKYPRLQSRVSIVRNSTDAPLRDPVRMPYRPEPPYTIAFAGHVYWPQEESVHNLLRAMELLIDQPIRLRLLVLRPPDSLRAAVQGRRNVELGTAASEELPAILQAADLLFLPFGWNTPRPEIIRTASPAKLSEYLASGTPILVHAPEYALVSGYVVRHECGFVVSENNADKLAAAIRGFFAQDAAPGTRYSSNALRMAREHFDPAANASAFRAVVQAVMQG